MASTLSFVPNNDDKLLAWSVNFSAKLTAAPVTYGMVAAQATQYSTAHTAFATALTATKNPDTRTKASVNTKDLAKASLMVLARGFGKMIQANPNVTDALKIGMGLTVRAKPQPRPTPQTAPVIEVISVSGWTLKIALKAAADEKTRGKPVGVNGANVFSFVGPTPPSDMSQWKYEGMTGKTTVDVELPSSVPGGSRVWLTAFWFNGRKESGPAAPPIGTNLQGGTVSMAA